MSDSAARDLQLEADDSDDALTLRARARHPGARHWWGRRSSLTGAFARCYLCGDVIATWSGGWPITEQARAAIAVHRLHHIQADLGVGATPQETRE